MRFLSLFAASVLLAACAPPPIPEAPEGPEPVIKDVRFENGAWEHDLASGEHGVSRGYHRAVVMLDSLDAGAEVAVARVPWRRPDSDPGLKDVLVYDASNDSLVTDRVVLAWSNDEGVFAFRTNGGSREYHVYYLPYETNGGFYPKVTWRAPTDTADPTWAAAARAAVTGSIPAEAPAGVATAVTARTVAIQWQDDFHSFFPMQVAATIAETTNLGERPFAVFAEDRSRPIRMRDRLPFHWAASGPSQRFEGAARPGEYYTFQIGVYAPADSLADLKVEPGAFMLGGEPLAADAVICFNTGGIDEFGRTFTKRIDVPAGRVQPLWIGVDLPERVKGRLEGTVTVTAAGASKTLEVSVEVGGPAAKNRGFNEPENQSRLAWLNSTVGNDPDFVSAPYEPVAVDGKTLKLLGREVNLGATGLPETIATFFTPEMTSIGAIQNPVLAAPIRFGAIVGGTAEAWTGDPYAVTSVGKGRAEWTATSRTPSFGLTVRGALEYDGMLDLRLELVATSAVEPDDIRFTIPYAPEAAKWMLGLGRRGGLRPETIDWKWNVDNHQEGAWLGGINRGLQYVLRDPDYVRPLNTNFYRNQPLKLPPAWYNEGKGGIRIAPATTPAVDAGATATSSVDAVNYSGPRTMAAGDTLHFHVRFLITPFHALPTQDHFATRFVHQYVPVDTVKAWGGTVVNIHHANEINPYINYPFYALDEQKAYIEEAHRKGIKVKLYNTIREITYRAHELFALRSLGDEILNDGEGGGHPWLQEHLGSDYHSAWHAFTVDDAAILDKGTSRWTNYYVEGLKWLAEYQQIDGLYLDDIAFSRETVKRIVNVLHEHRDEVVIDLHSANQFNVRDGWTNSAFLYMEHFPFISRLWFGEYFDYSSDPDFWMTEVSGIPFGLMGEMLQDGGHPYRGLLYGMTARKYGDTDPRPVWKMMTDFSISDSKMLGYWLDAPPVTTGDDRIKATTYLRDRQALIVLASWSTTDRSISLSVDWTRLGIADPSEYVLRTPAVRGLQAATEFRPTDPIPVPAGQGLFLILQPR